MAENPKANGSISVSAAVNLIVPNGATGSMGATFDGKVLMIGVVVKSTPIMPCRFLLEIPWGQVYGMGKKAGLCGKRKGGNGQ